MFRNRQAGVTTLAIDITDARTTAAQLATILGKAPDGFFAGMPFVADLNQSSAGSTDLRRLKQLFYDCGLMLIGITNHGCTTAELVAAGLADIQLGQQGNRKTAAPPLEEKPAQRDIAAEKEPVAAATAAQATAHQPAVRTMVIRRHVRSGQRVYAKNQDLIVIGTVGAGAEIMADGHVSVYGALRGRAFAGVNGDHDCFIFCSALAAELIAIAGCYQTMEQFEVYKGRKNCLITLNADASMQIQPLMA